MTCRPAGATGFVHRRPSFIGRFHPADACRLQVAGPATRKRGGCCFNAASSAASTVPVSGGCRCHSASRWHVMALIGSDGQHEARGSLA